MRRKRRKKKGSDEGSGHPHLKVTALSGRLKPTNGSAHRTALMGLSIYSGKHSRVNEK
jgi:hypothetical protein